MARIALLSNFAHTLLGFRRDLIRSLADGGHKVYCFAPDFDAASRHALQELGGMAVSYTLNSRGMNPLQDLRATWQLARQLRRLKIDAMLACFVKPVIFGAFAAKLAGVARRVGMIEGLGNAFTRHAAGLQPKARRIRRIQAALYRLALPLLDTVILLNDDDRRDLLEHHRIRTRQTVILGAIGLNLADYPPQTLPEGPVSFVFVGRLLREKGVFELLAAAEQVKTQYPSVRITLVGGFDHGNPFALSPCELQPYLDRGTVRHLGHSDDVAGVLAAHHVFVLPSYREGFPRSTQEAMAVGRTVITTDVPGCRDTVVHGVNGLLVPPYDADALAAAMLHCIENPAQVQHMAQESRTMAATQFDVHPINRRLTALLLPENGG